MTSTNLYDPALLLAAIRKIATDESSSGHMRSTNPDMDDVVWLTAWPGEIQYMASGDMAGQTWFLTWDQTHALDHEEELTMTEGLTITEAAIWLLGEARVRNEATL